MRADYKVILTSGAQEDIADIEKWFDKKGIPEAFIDFHTLLLQRLEGLQSMPMYQIRYADVRCLPLVRFKYTIHFSVRGDEVIIWALVADRSDDYTLPSSRY